MGKIENPTLNEMKVIVECEKNDMELDEDFFCVSEIEDLYCYMLDECYNGSGLISDSQSHYTNEFGDETGVGTDILYQARTIVNMIDNLEIYQQAKELIKICEKHNVKELEFIER